ncbi:hypothetical protein ETI05_00140 [Macrococcoides canis]|uniref:hypothetical protein n=1 Tax=Macrococcoides canis TaxID=1855823 RepID=UPI00105CD01A|nr:hypothetical protein [Macrococcus canis]TDM21190.1 hypothetical protein ETI05_00140 [Macrococcus canis]TDM23969.1 hypothetical protein ETI02_06140 [Macrococcus canis]
MKKYRTRLHYKRKSFFRYLIIPISFLVIYGTMKYFNYHLEALIIFKEKIPNIYLSITLCVALLSLLLIWLLSPVSPFKSQRMRLKLKDIIEINKFYYLGDNTTRIRNSMVFVYWWHDNRFYLRAYPHGGKWTAKTNELTEILESSFNMLLETVDDGEPNYTLYVFNTERIDRIDATKKWSE